MSRSAQSLPLSLTVWLAVVSLAGVAAAATAAIGWPSAASPRVTTWALAGLVAATQAIPIPGTSVRLSADTPFLLALLALGAPREAVICSGLAQLVSNLVAGTATRNPYTVPFNVGVGWISGLAGAAVTKLPLVWPAPLLVAGLATAACNAALVAVTIRVSSGHWPGRGWLGTVSVTGAAYLASAALASMLAPHPAMLSTLLVLGPLGLLVGSAYRMHGERVAEKAARERDRTELFLPALQTMVDAIEARDPRGHGHNRRVRAYALRLGHHLRLEETAKAALGYGALLHDVGRIAVPDALLFTGRTLTAEELERVRRHAVIGSELIRHVPFPVGVFEAVRHHHERWDGAGYPDGLAGASIPLLARILAVCDAYDDLTTGGSARPPVPRAEALRILEADAGTAFDPDLVRAWVACEGAAGEPVVELHRATPISAEIGAVAREHARLSDLVYRDQLTGISNSRRLAEDLAECCRGDQPFAVVVLDLDNFKGLNDHLGHDVGDRALQLVGDALSTFEGPELCPYRNGGDEFVVLCRGEVDVDAIVERITIEIEHRPLALGETGWIALRTSAGGTRAVGGETPEEVLRRADTAMYATKRARRAAHDARGRRPSIQPWPSPPHV